MTLHLGSPDGFCKFLLRTDPCAIYISLEQLNWCYPRCLVQVFMRFCAIFWIVFEFCIHYGFDFNFEKKREAIPCPCEISVVADSYRTARWYYLDTEVGPDNGTKPSFAGPQPLAQGRQVDTENHNVQSAEHQCRLVVPMVSGDEWETRPSLSSLWWQMGLCGRLRGGYVRGKLARSGAPAAGQIREAQGKREGEERQESQATVQKARQERSFESAGIRDAADYEGPTATPMPAGSTWMQAANRPLLRLLPGSSSSIFQCVASRVQAPDRVSEQGHSSRRCPARNEVAESKGEESERQRDASSCQKFEQGQKRAQTGTRWKVASACAMAFPSGPECCAVARVHQSVSMPGSCSYSSDWGCSDYLGRGEGRLRGDQDHCGHSFVRRKHWCGRCGSFATRKRARWTPAL